MAKFTSHRQETRIINVFVFFYILVRSEHAYFAQTGGAPGPGAGYSSTNWLKRRYLDSYEKHYFLGEEEEDEGGIYYDEEDSRVSQVISFFVNFFLEYCVIDPDPSGSETFGCIRNYCLVFGSLFCIIRTLQLMTTQDY